MLDSLKTDKALVSAVRASHLRSAVDVFGAEMASPGISSGPSLRLSVVPFTLKSASVLSGPKSVLASCDAVVIVCVSTFACVIFASFPCS